MVKFSKWVALRESEVGEEAFIRAIHQNPHDNLTWLAYADWLEERGDPRSDLIRKAKLKPDVTRKGQTNHMGERQYQTFGAWKRAIQTMFPGATFEGDKDIAQATFHGKAIGEWDGATGSVYNFNQQ